MPDWSWQRDAACRGEDLVLFFGPDGERAPEREARERKAQAICVQCPARKACLDYAIRERESGVWGGANDEERQKVRRRRQRTNYYTQVADTRTLPAKKTCTACGDTKPGEDFPKNRRSSDGLNPQCRDCSAEAARERRARQVA